MVEFRDDGDFVRAMELVGTCFVNLEEQVDDVLDDLDGLVSVPKPVKKKFTLSKKVEFLEKKFLPLFNKYRNSKWNAEDRRHSERALVNCRYCLRVRKKVSHASHIRDMKRNVIIRVIIRMLRKRRQTEVNSAQVYELANKVSDTVGEVYRIRLAIGRLRKATG